MHDLNDIWTLWLHLPFDTDWSINSYKKVSTFKTLEECIMLIENIKSEIVEKCMLFIMKNNIKPIWEDINNKNGGCLSYKISINKINEVWKNLTYSLLCNYLINDEDILLNINGISISPKKNFSIIKIWFKDAVFFCNLINKQLNKNNLSIEEISNMELEDIFKLDIICNIEKHICIFKKHNVLY